MCNTILVGITGFARSGKDTMARLISGQLSSKNIESKVFSFARELKKDLDGFCIDKFNISSFEEDSDKKNKIRPLLVAYGKCQRDATNGKYWFEKIRPDINNFLNSNVSRVAIISDLRFKEYEFDEYDFVRSYKKNCIITISRKGIMPANQQEGSNFPFFEKNSDINIDWSSSEDLTYLNEKAKICTQIILNKLLK